jgi:hypothetical protein
MSFAAFKSKLASKVPTDLAQEFGKKSYNDTRFWKLALPNGLEESKAVIRFLPQQDPDKSSFFRYYHFNFQDPNTSQYYIENCLNTHGDEVPDPCSEENRRLWNMTVPTGVDPDYYKNIARKRSRKTSFIANILVVKDNANPENNGKVFLFRFGIKILEKINVASAGNLELGKPPFDPTSFDDGANFALVMVKDEKSGFFVYDRSVFGNQSSIGDDTRQEEIYNQLYDLDTVLTFKPYNELKTRLDMVLGRSTNAPKPDESQQEPEIPVEPVTNYAAPTAAKKIEPVTVSRPSYTTDDEDEDMKFLEDLIPF